MVKPDFPDCYFSHFYNHEVFMYVNVSSTFTVLF